MERIRRVLIVILASVLVVGPTTLASPADDTILVSTDPELLKFHEFEITTWDQGLPTEVLVHPANGGEEVTVHLDPDVIGAGSINVEWQGRDGTYHGTLSLPSGLGGHDLLPIMFAVHDDYITGRLGVGPRNGGVFFRFPSDLLKRGGTRVQCAGICTIILALSAAATSLVVTCAKMQTKMERECCETARVEGCGGLPARGCGADATCGIGECVKDYTCMGAPPGGLPGLPQ